MDVLNFMKILFFLIHNGWFISLNEKRRTIVINFTCSLSQLDQKFLILIEYIKKIIYI